MRTLSSALLTELGLTVTRPGYLVQLGFGTPLYLSTLGDISYAGQLWSAADVSVSGLGQDGKAGNTATLTLGNTDGAYGALVLGEGASDVPVVIWSVYAGATASGDAVQVFAGVTNGADIDAARVVLALVAQANSTLYSPRTFISKPTFSFLQPPGTRISWGGETFVLERN